MVVEEFFAGRSVPLVDPGGIYQSIVIFLHGYGADGHNLLTLGHLWSSSMPKTLFLAPHAMDMHPSGLGYAWFDLTQPSIKDATPAIETAATTLKAFIENVSNKYQVPLHNIALVGFSQGGMMALHTGLCLLRVGAVVCYSGIWVPTQKPLAHQTPLLLTHGEKDQVLPASMFYETCRFFDQMKISYTSKLYPHEEHSIPEDAAEKGRMFLQTHLQSSTH